MPAFEQSPGSSDSTSSPESEPEVKSQAQKRPKNQQPARPKAKSLSSKHQTTHNAIEKRYRNNLNNKIAALRDSVPSLRIATKENYSDRDSAESDLGGRNEPQKLNKVSVAKLQEFCHPTLSTDMSIVHLMALFHLLATSSCPFLQLSFSKVPKLVI